MGLQAEHMLGLPLHILPLSLSGLNVIKNIRMKIYFKITDVIHTIKEFFHNTIIFI